MYRTVRISLHKHYLNSCAKAKTYKEYVDFWQCCSFNNCSLYCRRLINFYSLTFVLQCHSTHCTVCSISATPHFLVALSENRQAFKRIFLIPRMMRDVADVDLSLEVFGQQLSMPIFVSPAGERVRVCKGAIVAYVHFFTCPHRFIPENFLPPVDASR